MHAGPLILPTFYWRAAASDDATGTLDGVFGQTDRSSHVLSQVLRTVACTDARKDARKKARTDAWTEY